MLETIETITADSTDSTSQVAPSLNCIIPEWLQDYLTNRNNENNPYQVEHQLICSAFEFAYKLHEGQNRKSGEPYICHPVAVAGLLRELGASSSMVAAGFLHDVVEDTDITIEEIEQHFGPEVKKLVDGVTKLSKYSHTFSKTERQAENFRRMFVSMAQDIRVIVVKLADRLHNMRTLEHLPEEKRRRIALETREIFAPLANRLGIGRFKWELEDLCFKYLEPHSYRLIHQLVAEKRADRENKLTAITSAIKERLQEIGVQYVEVSGRPKHYWSIYQKMQNQGKDFGQIYDLSAVRILVNNNDECYRALAVVHDLFTPIPGRFKDYIGLPKPNGYKSLHTIVVVNTGSPLEVQIRTQEMHQIAEYGIAAHWKYKETGNSQKNINNDDEKFIWLRQLLGQVLEWQHEAKDAKEFLDGIKDNFFDEDVYVFSPKGEVVSLTQKSTPVDFAYRIHTEVGNHCAGSLVNGKIVPLGTILKNGDIVEILTQKNSHPSLDWLNFVVTSGAKNRIRQWFKKSNRKENIIRGRELLERELGKTGFEALLKSEPMQIVAEKCNYHSVEDLLAGLGYGEVTSNLVVNRLREIQKRKQAENNHQTLPNLPTLIPFHSQENYSSSSPILGIEGLVYHRAGCCTPIPGESIIGIVTKNRSISIHRQSCPNVDNIPGDRLIPVSWNTNHKKINSQTYPVNISMEVIDRVGVLNDILSRLTDDKINISGVQVKTNEGHPAIIDLRIDIRDRGQLDRCLSKIKQMTDFIGLRRMGEE
jgi:GTP diphosphokinase / guanosine-3',5'-bis(diphosphate) 3'-diphosphatase